MELSEAQIKLLKRVTGKDEVAIEDYFNIVSKLRFKITKTDSEIVDVEPIKNDGEIFVGGLPALVNLDQELFDAMRRDMQNSPEMIARNRAIVELAIKIANEKPEYILCSAIHFDDGKEHVHQPINIQTGFVICGQRHHNCLYTASLIGQLPKKFKQTQGFLTNTNRFVNREEAGEIAFKSGQIKKETDCLFSEDLW